MAIFFLHILSTRKIQIDVKLLARMRVISFFLSFGPLLFFTDHEWSYLHSEQLSEYFFRIELYPTIYNLITTD